MSAPCATRAPPPLRACVVPCINSPPPPIDCPRARSASASFSAERTERRARRVAGCGRGGPNTMRGCTRHAGTVPRRFDWPGPKSPVAESVLWTWPRRAAPSPKRSSPWRVRGGARPGEADTDRSLHDVCMDDSQTRLLLYVRWRMPYRGPHTNQRAACYRQWLGYVQGRFRRRRCAPCCVPVRTMFADRSGRSSVAPVTRV